MDSSRANHDGPGSPTAGGGTGERIRALDRSGTPPGPTWPPALQEEALRASEERLRFIADRARVGYWHWDLVADRLEWNSLCKEIFGIAPEEPIDYARFLAALHPDDRQATDRAVHACLESDGGTGYDVEYRALWPDGTVRWIHAKGNATFADGKPVRMAGIVLDITERKAAEKALHQQAEMLRLSFDAIIVWRLDGGIESWNRGAQELYGFTEGEAIGRTTHSLLRTSHPMPWAQIRAQIERTGFWEGELRHRAKDGRDVIVSARHQIIRGDDGIVRLLETNRDITERKAAEEALRASEERYRGIYEYAGTGIAITDLKGRFQSCNPAFAAMLGYREEELREYVFFDLVHPEDRDANLADHRRLLAEEIPSFEIFNRYLRKDGAPLWVHKRISLLRDADGHPSHIIVLVTDMSERKRQEEHVHLLMREVSHRAKNMLSLVLAIARQTSSTSPRDFVHRFEERIQSLAAAQDLLVKHDWKSVPLIDLVRSQLSHFADLIGTRVLMTGPALSITPAASQAIGMALHELATNAAKYGALSTESGRIAIAWDVRADEDAEPQFTLSWTEQGGPIVRAPARRGFGSMVTSSMIKMSLRGEVAIDYAAGGLVWRLACPASEAIDGRFPASIHARTVSPAAAKRPPAGPRILVVEDQRLIATEIESLLGEAGFDVIGPAASVGEALVLMEYDGCDAAVLDVNLGEETSEPIARKLIQNGTPFVVVSGYGPAQVPKIFHGAPLIGKPLPSGALEAEIRRCLGITRTRH